MTVRRIVFTGDFLRPSVDKWRPTQHENIQWFAELLRVPVQMATGLPTEMVHWDNHWINQPVFDADSAAALYRALWLEPSIQSWAQLYDQAELPDYVENFLLRLFGESFVIGFEIPPYLSRFFNRHGIGHVDCALSPIRFMDDLLFSIVPSDSALREKVKQHTVPEALIRLQAGVVGSNVAKVNPKPPRPNTLLLILQTNYDKVVIEDGRFVTVLDHMDTLREIARGYDSVLIKQHPLEKQQAVLATLLQQLPNAHETGENFYRLVAHPNLKGVAALSSSCVYEARAFGKKGHFLMPGPAAYDGITGEGLTIGNALITPDFWRDLLGGAGLSVTPHDGLALPERANRFRKQLRSAWSFNEIDTDIEASWAPKG